MTDLVPMKSCVNIIVAGLKMFDEVTRALAGADIDGFLASSISTDHAERVVLHGALDGPFPRDLLECM